MKKYCLIVLILVISFTITACKREQQTGFLVPQKAPEIDIIISSDSTISYSEIVPTVILLNYWDGAIYDRLSSIQAINNLYEDEDILSIGNVGNQVIIDFGQYKPDTIKLKKENRVLDDIKEDSYPTDIELTSESLTVYSFRLIKAKENNLNNQYVYTLTVNWGENSVDYAFCIEIQENAK